MPLSLDQLVSQLSSAGLVSASELAALRADAGDSVVRLTEALVAGQKLTAFQMGLAIDLGVEHLFYGEYFLSDRIGQGGMGVVYKAVHRRMKRVVALKMLPADAMRSATAVQRFYREVEAAARLAHPNIVTAYDAGEARGTHYLVMEFVEGNDLSTIVRQRGRVPVHEAVDYVTQAARGLDFAHQNGVIHRDIKPSNMLLARDGTVKLLDMGLALLNEEEGSIPELSITGEGRLLGTAEYMAPEQAVHAHDADHRSDIYSLGCTLYRLIAGAPPYSGRSTMEMVLAHREKPIRKLRETVPDTPEALEHVYIQMVAKRADHRFQSMAQVVAALEDLVATGTLPRFDRPRGMSRGGEASISAPVAIPMARSKRKKDEGSGSGTAPLPGSTPQADGSPRPDPAGAAEQDAMPVSGEDTILAHDEGRRVTMSETTSGAHGMMIDMAEASGASKAARPPASVTAALARRSRRPWLLPAAGAALLVVVLLIIRPWQTSPTPAPPNPAKDGSAKDGGVEMPALSGEWLELVPLGKRVSDRILTVPVRPEGSYRLDVTFSGVAGEERQIYLPVGPRKVALVVDGYEDRVTGLMFVKGFPASHPKNPTRTATFKLEPGKNHRMAIEVFLRGQTGDINVTVDGVGLIRWNGPLMDLSLFGQSWLPIAPHPATQGFGLFPVQSAKLQMLDGQAVLLEEPPKGAQLPGFVVAPMREERLDLLALLNLEKDRLGGPWGRDGHAVITSLDLFNRMPVPVQPMGDYELRVLCSFEKANQSLNLILPVGDRQATFALSSAQDPANAFAGIEAIEGKPVLTNPSLVRFKDLNLRPLEPNRLYELQLTVQSLGDSAIIEAKLDGRELLRWKGPLTSLSLMTAWQIKDAKALALGSWGTAWRYEEASLRMLSGKALLTRIPPGDMPLPSFVTAPESAAAPKLTVTFAKAMSPGGGPVEGLALSSGGSYLASTTFNKHIRVWDLRKETSNFTLLSSEADRCHVAVFSADSRFVAAASNDRHVYVFEPGKTPSLTDKLGPLDDFAWGVTFVDRAKIAMVTRDGSIYIGNLAANSAKLFAKHGGECYGIVASPDGKLLATCGASAGAPDGVVKLWDAGNGKLIHKLKEHTALVHAVDFVQRPGRNLALISASHDKSLKLWDTVTGQRLLQFDGHSDEIWNVVAHSSGQFVFSSSKDGTVRAWDTDTGGEIWQDKAHPTGAHGLAISGDGKRLATGGHDGQIRIYDVTLATPAAIAAPAEIDLLAISDPDKDTLYGKWRRTVEGLLSQSGPEGTDRLMPPVEITGEYDLSVTVGPSPSHSAVLSLPVGQNHATFAFHRFTSNRAGTGLDMIGGLSWSAKENPTHSVHPNFDFTVPHHFDISVRKVGEDARITVKMDGQPLTTWQGSPSVLTTYPRWVMSTRNRVSLNAGIANTGGNVLFQRAVLKSAGGTVKLLRPAPAAAKDD